MKDTEKLPDVDFEGYSDSDRLNATFPDSVPCVNELSVTLLGTKIICVRVDFDSALEFLVDVKEMRQSRKEKGKPKYVKRLLKSADGFRDEARAFIGAALTGKLDAEIAKAELVNRSPVGAGIARAALVGLFMGDYTKSRDKNLDDMLQACRAHEGYRLVGVLTDEREVSWVFERFPVERCAERAKTN